MSSLVKSTDAVMTVRWDTSHHKMMAQCWTPCVKGASLIKKHLSIHPSIYPSIHHIHSYLLWMKLFRMPRYSFLFS